MSLAILIALVLSAISLAPQEQAPVREHAREITARAAAAAKQRGSESEALTLYRESLDLWRAAGDSREAAQTLLVIGRLEATGGRKAEGRDAFAEAARLFHEVSDTAGEADAHYGVARQQFDLYDTAGAIASYEKGIALKRLGDDRFGLALALNNLAAAFREGGDSARAMECFREALSIRAAINDRPGVGYTLYGIAAIYWARGDTEQALETYAQALENWRTLGDKAAEANTLNGMGLAYHALGDRERGDTMYREALERWRAVKNAAGEAYTLNNVAMADVAAGRLTRALPSYEQALALLRTAKDLRGQAYVLHNLGDLQIRSGRRPEALRLYEESLALKRQLGDRFGEAYTLQRLSEALLAGGDARASLERAGEARELHRAVADRPGEAAALAAMARAQESLGQRAEARETMTTAVDLIERLRIDVSNDELRASYFARQQDYYEYLIALLMRSHRDDPRAGYERTALAVSERTRTRVLLERLAEQTSLHGNDLLARRRQLSLRLKEEIARIREAAQAGRRADATRLDALIGEYDALDAADSGPASRVAAITSPAPIDIQGVQRLLDGNTVLLEYALGKDASYGWLVGHSSVAAVVLPSRAVIERAVQRYVGAVTARAIDNDASARARAARIAASDADLPNAGRALARLVLDPFVAQLRASRIVVVSDGSLQGVPFAALPLSGGALLVTRYEVAHVASASLASALRRGSGAPAPASSVAVLADPVFTCDDERVAATGVPCVSHATFPRLRYSLAEANAINAVAPKTAMATGFDASRAALERPEFRRADILHFATHAVVDETNPAKSQIVLSRVDQLGRPVDDVFDLGAVASLEISASTVVLSACRTGLGAPLRGEGLIGISRAFFIAGARRVVATVWEVRDRATAEMMDRFYKAMFTEGLPPAAALRRAQLALAGSEQWRHPYYWAGVLINGDWR